MARQNRRGSGDSDKKSGAGLRGWLKKLGIWTGALGLLALVGAFAAAPEEVERDVPGVVTDAARAPSVTESADHWECAAP